MNGAVAGEVKMSVAMRFKAVWELASPRVSLIA